MANTHSTLTSLFDDIADSIRGKTGGTEEIIADNFPSAIDSIVLGSGNAQPADVLKGKTFSNSSGASTGTMTNNGAVSKTITTQGGTYTIPAGYHNGSGKVTATVDVGDVIIVDNGDGYATIAYLNGKASVSSTTLTSVGSVSSDTLTLKSAA